MNWGKGLIVAGATFMTFILVLSFYLMSQKPELETENYYEKDLVYQKEMEAQQNAATLPDQIRFMYEPGKQNAVIQLGGNQTVIGKIQFTRPSDASQDFSIDLRLDSTGRQIIATDNLSKGLWHIKASWQMNTKAYQSPRWEIVK
jgi:nitrogen fixation protein FixH